MKPISLPTSLTSPASSFAQAKQTIRSSDGHPKSPNPSLATFSVHAHEPPSAARPLAPASAVSIHDPTGSLTPPHTKSADVRLRLPVPPFSSLPNQTATQNPSPSSTIRAAVSKADDHD
ncbi:hypothetical protein ACLOJK_006896 [Asimina triloba]